MATVLIKLGGSRQKYIPIGESSGEPSGEAWGESKVRQMQEPCELTLSIGDVGGEFMKKIFFWFATKFAKQKTLLQK